MLRKLATANELREVARRNYVVILLFLYKDPIILNNRLT